MASSFIYWLSQMIYTVYVLYSEKHQWIYVGETSHLIQRFYSHNFFGHDWTKRFRPWVVIYCEYYDFRSEGKRRERQLKGGKGQEWIWSRINTQYWSAGFISAWGGHGFNSHPRYTNPPHLRGISFYILPLFRFLKLEILYLFEMMRLAFGFLFLLLYPLFCSFYLVLVPISIGIGSWFLIW